jgi:hypothetical protein
LRAGRRTEVKTFLLHHNTAMILLLQLQSLSFLYLPFQTNSIIMAEAVSIALSPQYDKDEGTFIFADLNHL